MTLRDECKQFLENIVASSEGVKKDIDRLEAFAKRQQAVGLREAAELYEKWISGGPIPTDVVLFNEWLEQQAREREKR